VLGRGPENAAPRAAEAAKPSRRDERRLAAEARERNRELRRAVAEAEAEVARLAERRTQIDRALFDPGSATGPEKNLTVTDLMKTRNEVERALARAEARWMSASEALEAAENDAA
jgi:ATP-binding cassette subfamily F protein 3